MAAQVGRVTEGQGPAFAENAGTTRSLVRETGVMLNDLVRTEREGRVAMTLGERTTLRMGGQARVRIDRFIASQGGTITIGSGAVGVDTQGRLPRGLTVRSPYALVAVRGTRFVVGAEPTRGFSVLVDEGRVDVRAGGVTVKLGPGEGTTVARRGERPSPPAPWSRERAASFRALLR
ncbi:MAG: FecR family protein [Phreatobacter sp.]|uniref:FecR family protein n=1 Tax=Phreatobacter sp. TaxID=1966341 RepID=UPI002732F3CF|nr:FecR family protein [Phreatobacter sp.]MDP2800966.1 FecR family protein [Phreatobacter sp.]